MALAGMARPNRVLSHVQIKLHTTIFSSVDTKFRCLIAHVKLAAYGYLLHWTIEVVKLPTLITEYQITARNLGNQFVKRSGNRQHYLNLS
jgi:hypothetical protein